MWIPWRRKTCPSVDAALWQDVVRELPILHGLDQTESERLKTLIAAFLAEKDFVGAHSFPVTDAMRIGIAASLCLPVLNLGLRWCKGWSTIIVYPDEFLTRHQEVDEIGVAHDIEEAKTGESWADGPLILSWADLEQAGDGYNVAIHEMAHKLDMLDGVSDGRPPLHADMNADDWVSAFTESYSDFRCRISRGEECAIDPYAAEAPEEFFAVLSEVFFELPAELAVLYPRVYDQLRRFYRQDPAAGG